MRRALRLGAPLTIQDLWQATRRKTTEQVDRFLRTALQNARANQCVSPKNGVPCSYHAGDVNQHAHAACVALLEFARRQGGVRYGPLVYPPARSVSSKECGCRRTKQACTNPCAWTTDGACVPASHNTRGFVGSTPHPDQRESSANAVRVRKRSLTKRTHALRTDPDSAADVTAGHARRLSYARRGAKLWRRPGSKVRIPVRRVAA